MAMLRSSCSRQLENQPSREVAALRTVQFAPELCATEGQSGEFNQDGMPSDGDSDELFKLLKGEMPTASIVLAMQKKIDAEETLYELIQKNKTVKAPVSKKGYAKPKAVASKVDPSPSSPSQDHWDVIPKASNSPGELLERMKSLLSEEEKVNLMNILAERQKGAASASAPAEEFENLPMAYSTEEN